MIFAELQSTEPDVAAHFGLVALLQRHFPDVRSGLQGDSWVWVGAADGEADGEGRVAIDTFTSTHYQVKSAAPSPLVTQVLAVLTREHAVTVFSPPVPEEHEDAPATHA